MVLSDVILQETLEKVKDALSRHEHFAAYNNTLLFIHPDDIEFFSNRDDANEFADGSISDRGHYNVTRIDSIRDFIAKVEAGMPDLTYKPEPDANPLYNKEGTPFGDMLIEFLEKQKLTNNKTIVMNEQNLEYLKKQLQFTGFGEGLNDQLEKAMKGGSDEFTLNASHEFGKDKMEAVLYFKKSEQEGKDMYFFNKYDAKLMNEQGEKAQSFFINNKGQSITFKEASNLLNGRSVYKELTPKEGEKYKAWVKLDHSNLDEKGNAKLKQFNENYGFDLKEAVGRLPFKEMTDPEQMDRLMASLQKGNAAPATLLKDGSEQKVLLAADPQFKTIKMYDAADSKKLFVPNEKVEQKYGQAATEGVKQEKKTDLLPKKVAKNNLLPKKSTGKRAGQALA